MFFFITRIIFYKWILLERKSIFWDFFYYRCESDRNNEGQKQLLGKHRFLSPRKFSHAEKKTSNHTKPSSATAAASEARNLILYMGRPTNQVYKRKNWSFWQGAIVHIDRRYIPNTYIRGFIYLCKLVTRLSSSSSKLKPDVVRPDANAGQVKPQWGQQLPKYAKNPHFKTLCFHDGFSKEFCTNLLFCVYLGYFSLVFCSRQS